MGEQQKRILIVCGEASGELQANNLILALREKEPCIKFSAVAGELLRKNGVDVFYDIKELSVIGLFDALKKLPKFLRLKKLILQKIKQEKPQAIILVDFSGFNLRLAKEIDNTIPIIYYISPQVWASRQGRVKTIKKYIRKMICLFKFEQEFYKEYNINAEFVGHPLLDMVQPDSDKKTFLSQLGFTESKPVIALFPGSRKAEIKYILPALIGTASLINKQLKDAQFVIAKSPHFPPFKRGEMGGFTERWGDLAQTQNRLNLKIVEGKAYDCMNIADLCIAASGTVTLEIALMQKPFIAVYKMSPLNYLLYRPQVKVPYICIVNIIANKKIIPEFIQYNATAENISCQALKILTDPLKPNQIKQDLIQFKSLLGEHGAANRAAAIILDFLKGRF